MQIPSFWKKKSIISCIIWPLSFVYRIGFFIHYFYGQRKAFKPSIPIISIGNLNIGGSGKTPIAIALAKILKKIGNTPHFISRGYGGNSTNSILVTKEMNVALIGDEPMLLSETIPCWVGSNKIQSIQNSQNNGADIAILDDGHQSHYINKSMSLLVVDEEVGFGNSMLIPSGPLREPLKFGLQRSDAILLIKNKNSNKQPKDLVNAKKPIFLLNKSYIYDPKLKNMQVFGFAGIAFPERFKNTIISLGLNLVEFKNFSDHFKYSKECLDKLIAQAGALKAELCTTKKDWVRLSKAYQEKINYIDLSVEFENEELFIKFIKQSLLPLN